MERGSPLAWMEVGGWKLGGRRLLSSGVFSRRQTCRTEKMEGGVEE